MLRGNLAPDGAVLKPSAASPHLLRHRGRAVVFEDIDDYKARIDDEALDIDETCVMVLKNCGPRGYPGMAEVGNMGLPPKVLRKGITDMVRISDARMSGTAYGTVVLHAAPEAARGGPLAVVRTGDMIELDVPARRLHLDVADAELARAARGLDAAGARGRTAATSQLYHDHVGGADTGADLDFLKGCRGQRRRPGLALMAAPFPVALVGVGKIARDQHIPAIAADPDFELVAARVAQRDDRRRAELHRPRPLPRRRPAGGGGALRAAGGAHRDGAEGAGGRARRPAREAAGGDARRGRADGRGRPRQRARCLFATWHSRFAPAVAAAKAWLADRAVRSRRASSGRRTCAAGTPARPGSGRPAASASSTPASTRCRS